MLEHMYACSPGQNLSWAECGYYRKGDPDTGLFPWLEVGKGQGGLKRRDTRHMLEGHTPPRLTATVAHYPLLRELEETGDREGRRGGGEEREKKREGGRGKVNKHAHERILLSAVLPSPLTSCP